MKFLEPSGLIICKDNTQLAQKLVGICENLTKSTVITMGTGFCLGTSTVIKNFLKLIDVESKMVEVNLLIQNNEELFFIGYEDVQSSHIQGTLETHVVVLTTTNPAYIIDASIGNYLPNNKGYFIYQIPDNQTLGTEPFTITVPNVPGYKLTYSLKRIQKYSAQVQESVIERINTDNRIFKNLTLLRKLIYIALLISSINLLRGTYDYYLTYINKDNYWGPAHIEEIINRLDKLEKQKG